MITEIEQDLEQIVNMLLLNGSLTECPGLVHGKMGIAVFFLTVITLVMTGCGGRNQSTITEAGLDAETVIILENEATHQTEIDTETKTENETANEIIDISGEYPVSGDITLPDAFRPNSARAPDDNVVSEAARRDSSMFFPTILSPTRTYWMRVWNIGGNLMFETTDRNRGWNGFVKDQDNLATATLYLYSFDGIFENGQSFSVQGSVRMLAPK